MDGEYTYYAIIYASEPEYGMPRAMFLEEAEADEFMDAMESQSDRKYRKVKRIIHREVTMRITHP